MYDELEAKEENLKSQPPENENQETKENQPQESPDYAGEHSKKECKECKKLKEELHKQKTENEKLNAEKCELMDSYKRKVAEFDNYRKRTLKQIEDTEIDSTKKLIVDILPIFDNFGRAMIDADKNHDFSTLYNGLKITYSQIGAFFEKIGVKPIDAVGKEFDHNYHEALMMEEREDIEHEKTVIEELEKGYQLGDSVLRTSKVKVAKKKIN